MSTQEDNDLDFGDEEDDEEDDDEDWDPDSLWRESGSASITDVCGCIRDESSSTSFSYRTQRLHVSAFRNYFSGGQCQ